MKKNRTQTKQFLLMVALSKEETGSCAWMQRQKLLLSIIGSTGTPTARSYLK
jgi:hypothetical protein